MATQENKVEFISAGWHNDNWTVTIGGTGRNILLIIGESRDFHNEVEGETVLSTPASPGKIWTVWEGSKEVAQGTVPQKE